MVQWEKAWNKNTEEEFIPSWVSVLDEYIMEWINKYCPGFMCVGHKLHPFGNEHHTISYALTSNLFRALIVGPTEITWTKKYSDIGQTVGLMLRMCKTVSGGNSDR